MRPLPKTLRSVSDRVKQILEALKEPPNPPVSSINQETNMATKAKKVVKKVTKKAPAKTVAKKTEGIVTLAELAEKAGISPQRARQKLREAEFVREGRWSWEVGHKEIAKVEAILASKGE